MGKSKTIYTDKDYLDAQFAEIKNIVLPLVKEVEELKEHKQRADGFMGGAKWVAALLVGAVAYGFIKLGIGDAIANTQDIAGKS